MTDDPLISLARSEGRTARVDNIDRSLNPYPHTEMAKRMAWYEGWDHEQLTAPNSTGGSTWNTGNLPGG